MSAPSTSERVRSGYATSYAVRKRMPMTPSTASTATPARHAFDNDMEEVKLSKTDLNTVIMDYLISEGYPSAAQKFAHEANIRPVVDVDAVEERVAIREALHKGNIQVAIEKINELNPQLLDRDSSLHFALLRLQLIELIRPVLRLPDGDIMPAVNFAQTHLAPRAPTSPEFLEDLERTMALLIFDPDKLAPPLAALLEPELRHEVGRRVNQALLASRGERTKATLYDLVNHRAWANQKAIEAKKEHLPDRIELGFEPAQDGQDDPRDGSPQRSNGQGDAMATGWENY